MVVFLILLTFYGDAWLVPWHDEVVISQLARNIAEGKGFRNDLLDDLLIGADKRTYWQMPVYPFALSLWGSIFGFDLNGLRWFSRLVGALCLLLLLALAVQFQLPKPIAALALLWTATDLTLQFASNFVRPDILTCCFLMSASLVLTYSSMTAERSLLAGLLLTTAVFTHPVALPYWLTSGLVIVKKSGWRNGLVFSLPFWIGVVGWLGYVMLDWEIFLGQMKAHLAHKNLFSFSSHLISLLGLTFWGIQFCLGVVLNSLPWLSVLGTAIWIGFRERWVLPSWFILLTFVLYASVTLGIEVWYPPLFVPFGYLLLAAMGWHAWQKANSKAVKILLLTLAFSLWVYQASVVARHIPAVPKIRQQVKIFVTELERLLPKGAVLLVGSFSPDPTFALMRLRPDLKLYQLMPAPMLNKHSLKWLRGNLTHMLVLEEATKEPLFEGHELKRWRFDFGGLAQPPHRGVTIVLLKVSNRDSPETETKRERRIKGESTLCRTEKEIQGKEEDRKVVGRVVTETELWERLNELPRVRLGTFPTPLELLPRISELLGVQVYIKRDDLTGLAFGGNKARHLEFGLGQAIHEACDLVINGAAVQSNYCRQTAAACAKLGLKCALVLRRNPKSEQLKIEPQGNLLLDYLFGADIRFIGPDEDLEEAKEKLAEEYRAKGHKPFIIRHPDLSGGFGYLVCLLELVEQCRELDIRPTHIVHSSVTPTQVGLVVGVKALGLDWEVLGVSPSPKGSARQRIAELSNLVAEKLGLPIRVTADEINLTTEFAGEDYGVPTREALEAMKMMARMEGIVLDPIYTAKAFAAIVTMARDGRLTSNHTVIFIHTGGTPALFAYQPALVKSLGLSART